MAVADRHGLPVAVGITSGERDETKLVLETLDARFVKELPEKFIGDMAYDSDGLDAHTERNVAFSGFSGRPRLRAGHRGWRHRCARGRIDGDCTVAAAAAYAAIHANTQGRAISGLCGRHAQSESEAASETATTGTVTCTRTEYGTEYGEYTQVSLSNSTEVEEMPTNSANCPVPGVKLASTSLGPLGGEAATQASGRADEKSGASPAGRGGSGGKTIVYVVFSLNGSQGPIVSEDAQTSSHSGAPFWQLPTTRQTPRVVPFAPIVTADVSH
jgi:hypothetical protein